MAVETHMSIGYSHIPGVKLTFPLIPYEVEVDGTTEYTRYTSGKMKTIKGEVVDIKDIIYRKTVVGSITRMEKAYALWANRKSSDTVYIPVNEPFDGTGATTYQ